MKFQDKRVKETKRAFTFSHSNGVKLKKLQQLGKLCHARMFVLLLLCLFLLGYLLQWHLLKDLYQN